MSEEGAGAGREETVKSGDRRIFVRSWQPSGSARAVVVLCHGFNSHSGYYVRTGEALAARGLAVTEATPEQHDRAMSVVQVLTHFQTQVLGLTLAASGGGRGTRGGNGDRSGRGDLEGVLELLDELGQLDQRHLLERVEQVVSAQLRHFGGFLSD